MTLTWRNDVPRLRRRSAREGTGERYYGSQLRAVLAPKPPQSFVDKLTDYYYSHRWPSRVLYAFGVIVASAAVAAWIVL